MSVQSGARMSGQAAGAETVTDRSDLWRQTENRCRAAPLAGEHAEGAGRAAARREHPHLERLAGEVARRRDVQLQDQLPILDVEIGRHHRPIILVDQYRDVARRRHGHTEAAFDLIEPVAERGDLLRRLCEALGGSLDSIEAVAETLDILGEKPEVTAELRAKFAELLKRYRASNTGNTKSAAEASS